MYQASEKRCDTMSCNRLGNSGVLFFTIGKEKGEAHNDD